MFVKFWFEEQCPFFFFLRWSHVTAFLFAGARVGIVEGFVCAFTLLYTNSVKISS